MNKQALQSYAVCASGLFGGPHICKHNSSNSRNLYKLEYILSTITQGSYHLYNPPCLQDVWSLCVLHMIVKLTYSSSHILVYSGPESLFC